MALFQYSEFSDLAKNTVNNSKMILHLTQETRATQRRVLELRSTQGFSVNDLVTELSGVAESIRGAQQDLYSIRQTNRRDVRVKPLTDYLFSLENHKKQLTSRINIMLSGSQDAENTTKNTVYNGRAKDTQLIPPALIKKIAANENTRRSRIFSGGRLKPTVTAKSNDLGSTIGQTAMRSLNNIIRPTSKTSVMGVESSSRNAPKQPDREPITGTGFERKNSDTFERQALRIARETFSRDREYQQTKARFDAETSQKITSRLDELIRLTKARQGDGGGRSLTDGLPNLPDLGGGGKKGLGGAAAGFLLRKVLPLAALYEGVDIAQKNGIIKDTFNGPDGVKDAYDKNGVGGAVANALDVNLYKYLYSKDKGAAAGIATNPSGDAAKKAASNVTNTDSIGALPGVDTSPNVRAEKPPVQPKILEPETISFPPIVTPAPLTRPDTPDLPQVAIAPPLVPVSTIKPDMTQTIGPPDVQTINPTEVPTLPPETTVQARTPKNLAVSDEANAVQRTLGVTPADFRLDPQSAINPIQTLGQTSIVAPGQEHGISSGSGVNIVVQPRGIVIINASDVDLKGAGADFSTGRTLGSTLGTTLGAPDGSSGAAPLTGGITGSGNFGGIGSSGVVGGVPGGGQTYSGSGVGTEAILGALGKGPAGSVSKGFAPNTSAGTPTPAPGPAGEGAMYRPKYNLSEADLSDEVVRTVAGEARLSNPAGVDAVINTMMNRVGSKGYGPSGNLADVARAPGQFAGYNKGNTTPAQAKMIRDRITAIASGSVADNTGGANEFRAESYAGPWAQKHLGDGKVIGGNRFAKNGAAPGTYHSYVDPKMPAKPAGSPAAPTADISDLGDLPGVAKQTPQTGSSTQPGGQTPGNTSAGPADRVQQSLGQGGSPQTTGQAANSTQQSLGQKPLGFMSSQFEGAAGNPVGGHNNDVDMNGNPHGVSYGKYSFNSFGGASSGLARAMQSNDYMQKNFAGLTPGSPEFTQKWSELARTDKDNFAAAQDSMAKTKWYQPAADFATKQGFKMDNQGVQEAIFSGSIQHGGINKIIARTAANNPGFADMSPQDQLKAYYDERTKYYSKDAKRYQKELAMSTALANGNAGGGDANAAASPSGINPKAATSADLKKIDSALSDRLKNEPLTEGQRETLEGQQAKIKDQISKLDTQSAAQTQGGSGSPAADQVQGTLGQTNGLTQLTPRPNETSSQLYNRLKAANPGASSEQCVALAKASVGLNPAPGASPVTDWRKGDSAVDKELPIGTPVATFQDRQHNPSDKYDAGIGVGAEGARSTHAAVVSGYDKDAAGNITGMKVLEQYRGSGGIREKTYPVNPNDPTTKSANSYFAINSSKTGMPLGNENNPLYRKKMQEQAAAAAAAQPQGPPAPADAASKNNTSVTPPPETPTAKADAVQKTLGQATAPPADPSKVSSVERNLDGTYGANRSPTPEGATGSVNTDNIAEAGRVSQNIQKAKQDYLEAGKPKPGESFSQWLSRREEMGFNDDYGGVKEGDTDKRFKPGQFSYDQTQGQLRDFYGKSQQPGTFENYYQNKMEAGGYSGTEQSYNDRVKRAPDEFTPKNGPLSIDEIRRYSPNASTSSQTEGSERQSASPTPIIQPMPAPSPSETFKQQTSKTDAPTMGNDAGGDSKPVGGGEAPKLTQIPHRIDDLGMQVINTPDMA